MLKYYLVKRRAQLARKPSRQAPRKRVYKKKYVSFRSLNRKINYPFGKPMYCKLKYASSQYVLNSTAGGISSAQVFRLNSLFDPDYSGVGAQPRYFDTLVGADSTTAPYNKYTVMGCKYIVKFMNTTAGLPVYAITSLRPAGIGAPASLDEAKERRYCQVKTVPSTGAAVKPTVISGYISIAKLFGLDRKAIVQDDNDLYGAAYNASPSRVGYLDIFSQAVGNNNTVTQVDVTLIFYCRLRLQNDVANS